MARWSEIEAEAPELTARARAYLDAHVHKTIATLRRDGSPRISGTELNFTGADVYIGSMWQAVKARDLQRDPRFAIHSGSDDPDAGWSGDAKLSGRMEEITDPAQIARINGSDTPGGRSHLFRCDVDELVVVSLNETRTKLVIESWHAGRGLTRIER